jgi:phospholipid/cholesterol/gamma-HCH transport system permease protein
MPGIAWLRQRIRSSTASLAGYWILLRLAAGHAHVLAIPPVWTAFLRQIYFTGIEAWRIIAVLALLAGALIVTQLTAIVGGRSDLAVKVFGWALLRELGPLLTATIIIARSSAAIASELALMRVHNETAHLLALRIPPEDYLAVPRVAGVTVSVVALTVHFQFVAVLGGLAVTALMQNVSFAGQLSHFLETLDLGVFVVAFIKSVVFGVGIGVISCFHGLDARAAPTEVPKAAIKAVMHSLVFVFVTDALFAWLAFVL